jgi:DNA polymerase-3 subunit gamma/tau
VEGGDAEIAELRALSEKCEEARLRRMFRALLKEQEDLAWAPQPFAVLEMAAVRLATMPAGDDVAQLLARIDALERKLREDPSAGGSSGSASRGGHRGATSNPSSAGARGAAPTEDGPEREAAATAESGLEPEAAAPKSGPEAPADSPPSNGSFDAHPAVVLDRLRGFIGKNHPGLVAALEGGKLLEQNDHQMRVFVEEPFAAHRLRDRLESLETACAEFFGHPIRVQIETTEANAEAESDAATDAKAALTGEALRELTQRALKNPAVNRAVEILDGEIVEIRPTGHTR